MGNFFKNTLTVICSLFLTLLTAEVALRFLPVNEGLRTQPVNELSPIAHFEPNRTSTWSRFADFSMTNSVHSNNYGFINNQEYDPKGEGPLIAVIGDSYVEAAMVEYGKTFHGRLAQLLEGQWRVYSFGISGAPLSQYLAQAAYASDVFHPEKMIFVIVGNDFDESLIEYKSSPGFHYFDQETDESLKLLRVDYQPSLTTSIFRNSKLAMYLITNVQIQHIFANLMRSSKPGQHVGQTAANANTKRLSKSYKVVDAFFQHLPQYSALSPENILFVMDTMRPHLYTAQGRKAAQGSFADIMRTHFMQVARTKGYEVVDMTPTFLNDFKRHGQRFEFERDGHWNNRGHEVVTQAIANALKHTPQGMSE